MAGKTPGIRASGKGIRITVWHKGKAVYDKTHEGNVNRVADLKAAIKFREELVHRLKIGLPLSPEHESTRRQFSMVAQQFLDAAQVDLGTRADYKSKLNKHCMPYLGHLIFEEITRQQVADMVGHWELSASSKQAVLRVLRSVFKYGGRYDNPAVGVSAGRAVKAAKDRYKPAERDALLAAMTGQAKAFFTIFFSTGMRSGEILALEWADYDGSRFVVNKQYTRGQFKPYTKTKTDRVVYVPTWARGTINAMATRLAGKRLFEGNRATRYYDDWREAHDKARVGAHRIRYRRPYTCRHTRASELLSSGVLPAQAALQLGHSPAMFLKTYAGFVEEFCQDRDESILEGVGVKQGQKDNVCNLQ